MVLFGLGIIAAILFAYKDSSLWIMGVLKILEVLEQNLWKNFQQ